MRAERMSFSQGDGDSAPADHITDTTLHQASHAAAYDDARSESSTSTMKGEVEDSKPPPKRADPKLCGICAKEVGKYKCPMCSMPFCSVACNRTHKENHPPPSEKTKPPPPAPAPAEENNDPFKILLDNSAEFQRLINKYPFLPEELNTIIESTLPPKDADGPNNSNALLASIQQHTKKQKPWSRESGLRNGAAVLRKVRTDPTERGDAIRELCDLILYLLRSRNAKASNGTGGSPSRDLTELVRSEVVEEETKIIERLLQEESREDRDK